MPGVTVGERILVHLSGFLRHADAYECPVEMTQDGIAASLGLSRAHVALELKRLRVSGRVQLRMAHVLNARSRRKVYDLTPAGQEISRRMREHARAQSVQLSGPEGIRTLPGPQAIQALREAGLRESEAVQRILASEIVELPRPKDLEPSAPPGPPFFGRSEERRLAVEWFASESHAVLVILGVAGIGKSAFVAHLLEGERRPLLVRRVYAHDDAHGLLCSFGDFLARNGRRRLKAVLTRPAYDPVEAVAVLREDLSGCVVALDDLHACEAADTLLRALTERPLPAKLIVATRTQPMFYERHELGRGRVVEIQLEGLDAVASADLLAARGASLPKEDLSRVIAATRGHPLALELFAASGLSAGAVEAERYILDTVLEGLDDPSEGLLQTFAVLRRPVRSPESFGATIGQVRRLIRRSLLHHRAEGYWIHDVLKEFFLRRMGEPDRRQAHGRVAAYWMRRDDGLEEAFHRIEAGEVETAAARLADIGAAFAESARAGDLEAALVRVPRDARLDALLAETQMFLGKFVEARSTLDRLIESAAPSERLRARIHLGRIANRLAAYAEAKAILAAAVREAEALGLPQVEGEALRALGGAERRLGDLDAALGHLGRAAELLEAGSREHVRALTDLAASLIARGDLAGAKARLLEASGSVRNGSREEAAIEINLGIVLSREGEGRRAAATFARSAEIALSAGDVRFASYAFANAVDNLLRLDSVDAAAEHAERALSLAETIGDPIAVSTARANLGLVFAKRGDWSKAEEHLLGSVAMIERLDNPYSLASRYEEIARLYEAQGRRGEAAPWRARAEGLQARLQGGGAARGPSSTSDE